MDKFVKINSNQAGDFTASQNLIDFTIRAGDVISLRDSYLNFNVKVNVEEASTDGGEGIYPMDLQWKTASTDKPLFTNGALIKNCHVKSALKGQIENLRRNDQYQQLVATYTKSQRDAFADSYLRSNQLINPINKNQFTLFREINKTGSNKSRNLDICPVQVSLADIFDFCNVADQVDTNMTGDLHFHFEMNIDKLEAVQQMSDPSTDWANEDLKDFEDVTAEGDLTTLVTKQKYTDLNLSPYYVGQALSVDATGTGGGGDLAAVRGVIGGIVWDKANGGKLQISFTESLITIGTGEGLEDVSVTPVVVSSSSVELNFAECIYKVIGMPRDVPSSYMFNTYSTEETNGNGLTGNFSKVYELEPEATNVIVSFPSANDELVSSGLPDWSSYRLRLNNQDLFDRDIDQDHPLYYDRVAMTWKNMNYDIKNLVQNFGCQSTKTWDDVYDRAGNETAILANPTFVTERQKNLQVNIETTSPVNAITIFKQLPRSFPRD